MKIMLRTPRPSNALEVRGRLLVVQTQSQMSSLLPACLAVATLQSATLAGPLLFHSPTHDAERSVSLSLLALGWDHSSLSPEEPHNTAGTRTLSPQGMHRTSATP